jgi:hypothetical protein
MIGAENENVFSASLICILLVGFGGWVSEKKKKKTKLQRLTPE